LTIAASTETATGTVTLKNASTGTIYASSTGNSLAAGATINFAFDVNTLSIGAAGSVELIVEVDTSSFASDGDTLQLKIANAAADLSWSDNTTSADVEEDNYVGVGLPLTGATFVNPS